MVSTRKFPRVTLVGAGPGDPELITAKGIRALGEADVVFYDALANEELLQYVPPSVPTIYVGKRGGSSYRTQDEINQLIVDGAYQYGHAVRLKGGDPYIFGRGHEEQMFAEFHGLSVTVIPGISSAYAVPALQSIPLTKRGVSESFWVITGTTRNGTLSQDIALAAQSTATVVILMGMRQIMSIQAVFQAYGQGHIPVAIIQNGSMATEKIGIGTVNTMAEMAEREQLSSPAVIVIGEVVHERSSKSLPALVADAVQYG